MIRKKREYRVYPLDTKPNTAVGFKFPFSKDKPFTLNYTTAEQVKSNLMSFMLTNEGERVFNPSFGGDIKGSLFEQNTSIDDIKEVLIDKISFYFPQITNLDISFFRDDSNTVLLKLTYAINGEEQSVILQINN